jgi:hypothetical protein
MTKNEVQQYDRNSLHVSLVLPNNTIPSHKPDSQYPPQKPPTLFPIDTNPSFPPSPLQTLLPGSYSMVSKVTGRRRRLGYIQTSSEIPQSNLGGVFLCLGKTNNIVPEASRELGSIG